MGKRNRLLALLLFLFIVANGIVYYLNLINKDQRISIALEQSLNELRTHYEILLHNQKITADAARMSTVEMPQVIEILTKVQNSSSQEKEKLRKQLYSLLKLKYQILKNKGVLQYQFILPNNESFLRMHKPSKFGDNLKDVRADFRYTNKTHKPIRGFVQGRVAHGFRNVYPIFDKNGKYLAAFEISFSSELFQKSLTQISKIHAHFLVDKHIFDSKEWFLDDHLSTYFECAENNKYMLALNKTHTKKKCIVDNKKNLSPIREDIIKNMKKGKEFALYFSHDDNYTWMISFLPVKDLSDTKVLAWLVSYKKSAFIDTTLRGGAIISIAFFGLFMLLLYFIYKQYIIQEKLKEEHTLLDSIINLTDDIMFITNFDTVTFSNKKFKDFFNVENEEQFNETLHKNILGTFVHSDGYLYDVTPDENTTFVQLVENTPVQNRVVCILDQTLNPKAFKISLTKIVKSVRDDYLVTLSDITTIKEREKEIQEKAYIDELTQIYNRSKFDKLAEDELLRDIRYKRDLSITIIDIDHFKNFNDTYGHLIGDEVLIMLAEYINNHVRDTDTFARWGGEEFVILFPETKKDIAVIVCEKLRVGIEQLSHPLAGGITVSFGVTQYQKNDTLKTMFKRCDDALYKAKENGRNMVCSN